MLLIYQIPGGSSERWHGNQLGDLLWVDPAIYVGILSRDICSLETMGQLGNSNFRQQTLESDAR